MVPDQTCWEEPLEPAIKDGGIAEEDGEDDHDGDTAEGSCGGRLSNRLSTSKSSVSEKRPGMLRGTTLEISDALHLLKEQHTFADLAESRAVERSFRSRVRYVVLHRNFEAAIALVVLLNAVYIGVETENTMETGDDGGLKMPWYALDLLFVVVFWAELLLRLYVERHRFFFVGWNQFDAAIVLLATVDKCIVTFVSDSSSGVLDIVTVVRILRVARILRIVRLLRFCRELWLIVLGIFSAMRTLFWAWMLMALLCFIGSVFITRTIGHEGRTDPQIQELYGSMGRTFFTLFQILTVDDWVNQVNAAARIAWFAKPMFVLFVIITTFAVLNVVVAVIVNKTLENSINHSEAQVKALTQNLKKAREAVDSIFSLGDADGDGALTRQEYMHAIQTPQVMRFLHEVGVDLRRVDQLFDILDYDESGVLDVDEFVDGVMEARGEARSKDLLELHCEVWRWEQSMTKLTDEMKVDTARSAKMLADEVHSITAAIGMLKASAAPLL